MIDTEASFPPLPTTTLSQSDNYPRFFIVQSVDKSKLLSSQSVFLVSKFLEGILGRTYDAEKLGTGRVLVEVQTQQQATNLLTQTRMSDLDISHTPPQPQPLAGCDI